MTFAPGLNVSSFNNRMTLGCEHADPTQSTAVFIKKDNGFSKTSDFSIVIPREDKVYIAAPVHDIAATCVGPQALELFYRVLETFIVNQEPTD